MIANSNIPATHFSNPDKMELQEKVYEAALQPLQPSSTKSITSNDSASCYIRNK